MIELCAADLWSKHGFGDGDVADDRLGDLSGLGMLDVPMPSRHAVLRALVRERLVPALMEAGHHVAGLFDIQTIHNPIRVDGWHNGEAPEWAHEIVVEVSDDDLLETARRLSP